MLLIVGVVKMWLKEGCVFSQTSLLAHYQQVTTKNTSSSAQFPKHKHKKFEAYVALSKKKIIS